MCHVASPYEHNIECSMQLVGSQALMGLWLCRVVQVWGEQQAEACQLLLLAKHQP